MLVRSLAALCIMILGAAAASAALSQAPGDTASKTPVRALIAPQVEIAVPIMPTAFQADAKWHLVYELHVTNWNRSDCRLRQVEVVSGDAGHRILKIYAGADLDSVVRPRPGQPTSPERSVLAPGTTAVVFVWVTIDAADAIPAALRQRVVVKVGSFVEDTIETAPMPVGRGAVAIGSPLKGNHWLAANGPSNTSDHRRSMIVIDGHPAIAQRFAIDWVRLDANGKTFHGDSLNNANYYAYGSDALAVADGIVVETKDGIPQNIPGEQSRAVPITLDNAAGNHIMLDIGSGRYALYAHLQPGSLRVKVGDRVRRGQALGLVGNSGNSTEPHLHFHIENGSTPLGGEGLPYTLPAFDVAGRVDLDQVGSSPLPGGRGETHRDEIPTENELVSFP